MRNVIVTGGSRGIGLAIARTLVSAGYRVIAIARQQSQELRDAQAECEAAAPDSLIFRSFDLSEIERIPKLVLDVHKEFGAIYGLVNNAGISFDGSLALMPLLQIDQLIRVNTFSPIAMTKSVVRHMMADGGGRVVNMASITAFTGYSGLSVYSATKSAIIGFTRSLAREVGRSGITVNAVAPGFVATSLTHEVTDEQRRKIERRSALRRLTGVDDVANSIEFLLSDKAKSITGTVLTVDAGTTA